MELNARKRKILEAIVLDYISTAEAVGSRTIARKHNLGVSPATIRNEMADLEELGLIEQPYTSAGRIPSDAGYRYYVDTIMEKQIINDKLQKEICNSFECKISQLEDIIQNAIKVLSQFTSYTSIMLAPVIGDCTLQLLQMILVEPGKALFVVVTSNGRVENRMVDIPESITKDDLEIVSKVLNEKIRGLNVAQWNKGLLNEIRKTLVDKKKLLTEAIEYIDSILVEDSEEKVFLSGTLNILNQPEFKDVAKIKSIFQFLDNDNIIREVLKNKEEGLNITIGMENEFEGFQECSLITATYQIDGKPLGTIGLIGPTRMQYSKAVSILDYFTKVLSSTVKNI